MSEIINKKPENEKSIFRKYFLETSFTEKEIIEMEKRGWIDEYKKYRKKIAILKDNNSTKITNELNITKTNTKKLYENIKFHSKKETISNEKNIITIMEKNGLTKEIIDTLELLIKDKIIKNGKHIVYLGKGNNIEINNTFFEKNKTKILHNLKYLLILFADIESEGLNQNNKNGSSAKGYFQYLTGNGKYKEYHGKKYWGTSSYETACNNVISFKKKINNKDVQNLLNTFIPKNRIKSPLKNPDPKKLTWEQQILLFSIDFFSNNKKIKNKAGFKVGTKDFLGEAMIGRLFGIKQAYKIIHHTNPDKATLKRLQKILLKYKDRFIKIG